MKLLVVDLINPEFTHYRDHRTIGSWFLARRLDRYTLIAVGDEKSKHREIIQITSTDVSTIQKIVDDYFYYHG